MTPVRLLVIGVLLYILYKLLVGPRKKGVYGSRQGDPPTSGNPVQDVLVEDPVCHTYIPKRQAIQLHHDKKMYYFCSDKCCQTFLKDKGVE